MKSKHSKKEPTERAHPIKDGELFIKETFLRLHRQRHGLTTQEAEQRLQLELKSGMVEVYASMAEITIYIKTKQ